MTPEKMLDSKGLLVELLVEVEGVVLVLVLLLPGFGGTRWVPIRGISCTLFWVVSNETPLLEELEDDGFTGGLAFLLLLVRKPFFQPDPGLVVERFGFSVVITDAPDSSSRANSSNRFESWS